MAQFKFIPLRMGSNWISGHVAVDEYYMYHDREGSSEKCLNRDTESFTKFSAEIDRLIAELENIRTIAKRKFAEIGKTKGL